jgi:hypothetical protein
VLIGIDLDNTIVSYERIFERIASEWGLVETGIPRGKTALRDYLRQTGREDTWTTIQGHAYGERMGEAEPFPGVETFFARCRREGVSVHIISHRTEYPYMGPRRNLHEAAVAWLEQNCFFDIERIGLRRENVFFELTKEEKLQRIVRTGCTHFIDDLPELLADPAFPIGVKAILFDSNGEKEGGLTFDKTGTWKEIERYLFDKT